MTEIPKVENDRIPIKRERQFIILSFYYSSSSLLLFLTLLFFCSSFADVDLLLFAVGMQTLSSCHFAWQPKNSLTVHTFKQAFCLQSSQSSMQNKRQTKQTQMILTFSNLKNTHRKKKKKKKKLKFLFENFIQMQV